MVDIRDEAALIIAWTAAHKAYEKAEASAKAAGLARPVRTKSIADLIGRYRASVEYAEKAPSTKKDYEKGLKPLLEDYGRLPVAGMQRQHVAQLRDRYAWRIGLIGPGKGKRMNNAVQANRVVSVLSVLFTFACDTLGWRTDNPALRPKRLKVTGEGYRAWLPGEWQQFMERATPDWQFTALLALLTAQRGQDQITLTWSDYDGERLRVVQAKGGGKVKLWLPVHPTLRAALDARRADQARLAAERGTTAASTILTRPNGKPWADHAFKKGAGDAIRGAGLKGIVWHGLRSTAMSWAAEGGASEGQLQGLSGHRSPDMAQHYARGAEQQRMAAGAVLAINLPGARGGTVPAVPGVSQ